ncbi:MAG: 7-cyano-7-deazaguanine synthase [Candidatus Omnitrophica bacterium]|nr:7-cyano-7-deazaguanine synthase [Candidatus Omnitrophota bacterium]
MDETKSAKTSSKKKKALILLSGGTMSLSLLNEAARVFTEVSPVYVQSGFRWEEAELHGLKKFLRVYKKPNVEPLTLLQLPLKDLFGGHWSNTGVKAPSARAQSAETILPGRDFLMFAKAAVAATLGGYSVIGAGYTSESPMAQTARQFGEDIGALLGRYVNNRLGLWLPFAAKTRDEALFGAKDLNLEFSFSCMTPKGYLHCGECFKCHERKLTFFKSGMTDKAPHHRPLTPAGI